MNTRDPLPEVKESNSLLLEVKILDLKSPQTWKKETNNPEMSIMRRDKEVEEMLQEIRETQDLKIEGG
jgi:hypothetical protein